MANVKRLGSVIRATVLSAFALTLSASLGHAGADGAISIAHALDVVRAMEKQIQICQWKSKCQTGTYPDPVDLDKRQVNDELREGWVVFEPNSGRYRIDRVSVTAWERGPHPYISSRHSHSFDRHKERGLDVGKPGKLLPGDDIPAEGNIWNEDGNYFRTFRFDSGTGYVAGRFNGWRLSDLLEKEQKTLTVQQLDAGLWKFAFLSPDLYGAGSNYFFELEYDPEKGLVTGASVRIRQNDPPYRRMTTELQAVGEFWMPKVVRFIDSKSRPPYFEEVIYADVKVNHTVDEAIFSVAFPPGTRVKDHTRNASYVVGTGAEGDMAAVQAFMDKEGLRLPFPTASAFWKTKWVIAASVSTLLVLGGAAAFWFLKRRRVSA